MGTVLMLLALAGVSPDWTCTHKDVTTNRDELAARIFGTTRSAEHAALMIAVMRFESGFRCHARPCLRRGRHRCLQFGSATGLGQIIRNQHVKDLDLDDPLQNVTATSLMISSLAGWDPSRICHYRDGGTCDLDHPEYARGIRALTNRLLGQLHGGRS